MRKLTATLCLTIAVLLGSEVRGSDLPECEDSPKEIPSLSYVPDWDDCQGSLTFIEPSPRAGTKYVGKFKNKVFNGKGTFTASAPSTLAGMKYVGECRGQDSNLQQGG